MLIQPFSNLQKGFFIRQDDSASFVELAVPGTNFTPLGGNFGQTNFQSDISSVIKGSGTNFNLIVTSSSSTNACIISSSVCVSSSLAGSTPVSNFSLTSSFDAVFNFNRDGGYVTSVFQEDGGSIGAVPGSRFSNFTSTDWVVETWVFLQERLFAGGGPPFHKSLLRNTDSSFSCDISFVSSGSPLYRLRWIRGVTQYFGATNIASNLNAWNHVAFSFVNSSNTINGYWHGSRVLNTASTSGTITSNLFYRVLGGDMGVNDGAKGSVQDFRVSVGTTRGYTGTTISVPNSIVIKN